MKFLTTAIVGLSSCLLVACGGDTGSAAETGRLSPPSPGDDTCAIDRFEVVATDPENILASASRAAKLPIDSSSIDIIFNATVDVSSIDLDVDVTLLELDSDGNELPGSFVDSASLLDDVITVNIAGPLEFSTDYALEFAEGISADCVDKPLIDRRFKIVTEDTTAPDVSRVTPGPNDFPENDTQVVIVFNKAVETTTDFLKITCVDNCADNEPDDFTSLGVISAGEAEKRVFDLTDGALFTDTATYEIQIDTAKVTSSQGDALVDSDGEDDGVFKSQFKVFPNFPPQVFATSPGDDGTVAESELDDLLVSITFSEAVQLSDSLPAIKLLKLDEATTTTQATLDADCSFDADGDLLAPAEASSEQFNTVISRSVTGTNDFKSGEQLCIALNPAAITDDRSAQLVGKSKFLFTVGSDITVTLLSTDDGTEAVSRKPILIAEFSGPVAVSEDATGEDQDVDCEDKAVKVAPVGIFGLAKLGTDSETGEATVEPVTALETLSASFTDIDKATCKSNRLVLDLAAFDIALDTRSEYSLSVDVSNLKDGTDGSSRGIAEKSDETLITQSSIVILDSDVINAVDGQETGEDAPILTSVLNDVGNAVISILDDPLLVADGPELNDLLALRVFTIPLTDEPLDVSPEDGLSEGITGDSLVAICNPLITTGDFTDRCLVSLSLNTNIEDLLDDDSGSKGFVVDLTDNEEGDDDLSIKATLLGPDANILGGTPLEGLLTLLLGEEDPRLTIEALNGSLIGVDGEGDVRVIEVLTVGGGAVESDFPDDGSQQDPQ